MADSHKPMKGPVRRWWLAGLALGILAGAVVALELSRHLDAPTAGFTDR